MFSFPVSFFDVFIAWDPIAPDPAGAGLRGSPDAPFQAGCAPAHHPLARGLTHFMPVAIVQEHFANNVMIAMD